MSEHSKLEFPITTNYSPEVTVEILGLKKGKGVSAIVDTGFTGFLQIPLSVGIACNLRLWGVSWFTLADNSKVKNLQCFGQIRFADREMFGVITLSDTSDDCLLGMQFLQELKMDFKVSITDKKATFTERRGAEPERLQRVVPKVAPATPIEDKKPPLGTKG
jgi:clan AA aspartic protease